MDPDRIRQNCEELCFVCCKVEDKIAAELKSHGLLATEEQPQPRVPDFSDLGRLSYLSCVIKEAMRMHTVSHFRVMLRTSLSGKRRLGLLTPNSAGISDYYWYC